MALPRPQPSYNHTRADGPFDPCPQCLDLMPRAALIACIKDMQACLADLRNPLADSPTESKWPCFFCGSKQAHGVGFPQPGSISTVPACANCEALHTFDGRASETPPNGSETKP